MERFNMETKTVRCTENLPKQAKFDCTCKRFNILNMESNWQGLQCFFFINLRELSFQTIPTVYYCLV